MMLDFTAYVIEMVILISSAVRLDKSRVLYVLVEIFLVVESAVLELSSGLNQGEHIVRHPMLFPGGCKLGYL